MSSWNVKLGHTQLDANSLPMQHRAYMPGLSSHQILCACSSPDRGTVEMLTAYVDECGQEGQDDTIIAGYIGNDAAWDKLIVEWKAALAPRKALHMRELRWRGNRHKRLLAALGPIPDRCGLHRILGHVRVKDYADMFQPSALKNLVSGYAVALFPLIISVLMWIPEGENVSFYFEEQPAFAKQRDLVLQALSETPYFSWSDGSSKLAAWKAMPKSIYFEPADALAYAALQHARDAHSIKSLLCAPLLGNRRVVGRCVDRSTIRAVMQVTLRASGLRVPFQ